MVSTLPNLLPSIVIASCAWFQAEQDRLKAAGVLVPLSKAERIQARAVRIESHAPKRGAPPPVARRDSADGGDGRRFKSGASLPFRGAPAGQYSRLPR